MSVPSCLSLQITVAAGRARYSIGSVITTMRAEGVAVLLVEQDLHLAFAVAGEVAVMARGEIVHRVSTAEFRRDPDTAQRLLGVA